MAIVQPSADEPSGASGPGKRLRDVRIENNLTIEEVAARLRLDVLTIKRIEADDYAALPAPAFVRGYLRGYARLLNISPGPIVEAYDEGEPEPPPLVADISRRAQRESSDFPVQLVTYAIIATLVVLVVIWWRNQQPAPDQLVSDTPAVLDQAGEAAQASGELALDTLGSAAQSAPASTTEPEEVEEISPPEPTIPSATPLVPDPFTMSTSIPDTSVASAESAEVARTEAEETPPAAEEQVSPPTPNDRPMRGAQATLRITLTHDSWVEVYNRREERLYYSLAEAGNTIVIAEEAPFRVLLGYAQDAEVQIDGRAFDITPFVERGVARFTIGGEGASSPASESAITSSQSQSQ